jgi:hypothetical protein
MPKNDLWPIFPARIPNHPGIDPAREALRRQYTFINVRRCQDPYLKAATGIIPVIVNNQSLLA